MTHLVSCAQEVKTIEIDLLETYKLEGGFENTIIIFKAVDKKIKTVIDGSGAVFKSNVRIQCLASNVEFVNFTFKNPMINEINQSIMELGEKGGKFENIIVHNCNFLNEDKSREDVAFFYIHVLANKVTIKNCEFKGKHNRLPIIHVNSKFDKAEISNCSFKDVSPRKEEALEAVRIGDGTPNTGSYIIKNNIFENYFGDSETISCKASNMTISKNTFKNCRSGVSIRKANHVNIIGNTFTNVSHPVRVSGKDHTISGNTFDDTSDHSITFMMGNSDYWTSENIIISKNKFKNEAKIGLISNTEDGIYPLSVRFKNNYIFGSKKKRLTTKVFNKNYFEKNKPASSTEKYNIKQKTYIIQ